MTNTPDTPLFIVGAKRTPIGSFNGGLSQVSSTKLGSAAIKAAIKSAGADPATIDDCTMGQVLSAGVGQAPARQAALGAGLPDTTACTTVNKVCGSGLKAVMMACDFLRLYKGAAVAGGQENMSLAPHLLPRSRAGYKMGSVEAPDSMLLDGLWDPYHNWHMGQAAELCVQKYAFTREAQDVFARTSYERAQKAQNSGAFDEELALVEPPKRAAELKEDEEPKRARFDKMPALRPAFDKAGTITAANASKINDGAAAVVLATQERLKSWGSQPLARVVGYATHAQAPKWFTTAPVGAVKKLLHAVGWQAKDVDFWEINEAFSAVAMAAIKDLELDPAKVNMRGGAVALGHPIGASGARLLVTLLHILKTQKPNGRGVCSLCLGGGEAVALAVESLV